MRVRKLGEKIINAIGMFMYADDKDLELIAEFDLAEYVYTGKKKEIIRAPIKSIRSRKNGKVVFVLGEGERVKE